MFFRKSNLRKENSLKKSKNENNPLYCVGKFLKASQFSILKLTNLWYIVQICNYKIHVAKMGGSEEEIKINRKKSN